MAICFLQMGTIIFIMKKMKKRIGKTTRIIDRCIQELFKKEKTFVFERIHGLSNIQGTNDAFKKFQNRLWAEHPHVTIIFEVGYFDRIYCYKVEFAKN